VASFISIVRQDPIFGALLILLALGVVSNVLSGDLLGMIITAVIFWGIVTFRWWGYWLAMVLTGLGLAFSLPLLLGGPSAGALIAVGIQVFTLAVLYTHRDRFD